MFVARSRFRVLDPSSVASGGIVISVLEVRMTSGGGWPVLIARPGSVVTTCCSVIGRLAYWSGACLGGLVDRCFVC